MTDSQRSRRIRNALFQRQLRARRRTLRVELLEDRRMLAQSPISVDDMASLLHKQFSTSQLERATIVTHGFQTNQADGDSLYPLATAIRERADSENGPGQGAWLLDYDVTGEGGFGQFDMDNSAAPNNSGSNLSGTPSEIVLLFDWAAESNEPSAGWGEAAGDALFSLIVQLGIAHIGQPSTQPPLHFIGHSFSTAVTSEAVERLAAFNTPVDQVTYLYPHDFDESGIPIDGSQRLFDLGKPSGYGASVWSNVAFTDVYYQTREIPLIPDGRPIPGTYNQLLNSQSDVASLLNPHSAVWSGFYQSTVIDASINANTGFAFSKVAGGTAAPRPQATRPTTVDLANTSNVYGFYSTSQSHVHTEDSLKPKSVPTLTPPLSERSTIASTKQVPDWSSLNLINGDFKDAGDRFDNNPIPANNIVPGWSQHGGGGSALLTQLNEQPTNYALQLTAQGSSRTHNYFYFYLPN